jgi:DNA-binding response OmpR family regulator
MEADVIMYKELILKLDEGCALYQDKKIDLTKNELKILSLFIRNQEKIVSRNDLMTLLWNDDVFVNDNTLTVSVNRLRAKLMEAGLAEVIITKKGQGYMMV